MKSLKEINFSQLGSSSKVIVMNADFIKKDGNGNISMDGVKKFNISSGDDVMYKYYIDGRRFQR